MSKVPVNGVGPSPRLRIADAVLLDAATAVFAAEGFDRATMDAIAARAGATKPTLYARYGSKADLFAAAARREYELRKAALFEVYSLPAAGSFAQRLHRWTAAYFDFVRDRPDGFRLLSLAARHPASAAVIEQAAEEIVDRIAGIVVAVSGRQAPQGARLLAAMIAGMLNACAREAIQHSETDLAPAAALCESFLHAAVRGVDGDLIDAVG